MSDHDENHPPSTSPDPADFVTDAKSPSGGGGIDCSDQFVGVEDLVVVTGTSRGKPATAVMLMLDTDPGAKSDRRQTSLQMLSLWNVRRLVLLALLRLQEVGDAEAEEMLGVVAEAVSAGRGNDWGDHVDVRPVMPPQGKEGPAN